MSDKEKTNGSLAMAPRVITIPAANQETARKLRVAAYTRVSSNSKDQEHSFAAQNAYFSKLITDNPDWELADIYADQGITGTSIDKRDDFLRMMEDCRKGRIDRILVKSSSYRHVRGTGPAGERGNLRTGAVELQSPNEQREIFHLQSALWLSAR